MIQLSLQVSCHILPHCDISRVTHYAVCVGCFLLALCWPEVASYPFRKAHVIPFLPDHSLPSAVCMSICNHSSLPAHAPSSCKSTLLASNQRLAPQPVQPHVSARACTTHPLPQSIPIHLKLRNTQTLTQTSFSSPVPIPPNKMLRTLPRHLHLPRRR